MPLHSDNRNANGPSLWLRRPLKRSLTSIAALAGARAYPDRAGGGLGRAWQRTAADASTRQSFKVVRHRELAYWKSMDPATALVKQIEHYRSMTGEQRLGIALELHEMSCEIAREGIRRQNPTAGAAEVERLLRRRLELARAA
jgi:Rv0078B-related antitoxin